MNARIYSLTVPVSVIMRFNNSEKVGVLMHSRTYRFMVAALFAGSAMTGVVANGAQAAIYTGPTSSYIDTASPTNLDFTVVADGLISALSFHLTTTANFADDLTLSLSHLGTTVTFFVGHGDSPGSKIDALFTDSSSQVAPTMGSVIGTFAPTNPFSAFNGLAAGGLYTLTTRDPVVPGDYTALVSSSLTLSTTAGAVPEPATWALMIVGFGAVAGVMRRRRTSARVAFAA